MRGLRFPLAALLGLLLIGGSAVTPALAESDPGVQSWRIIQAAPSPSAPQQQYRARRRYDAPRYPSDATLGLHMPDIKVAMPLPDDALRTKIAVIGDSLADALAAGFEADAGFKTDFLIRQRTVSASGLVRDDFHNWPNALGTLVSENPGLAAVVILVGLNDRQILKAGDNTLEPLSEAWRDAYRARIDALIGAAKNAQVPVIWVGLPVMRSPKLSADLAILNEMMRERVTSAGETFVETVDGFTDHAGQFTVNGPDIIGDTVRLRGPDGIHFTPAGQRKLAFFVEKPLRNRIGDRLNTAHAPSIAALPPPSSVTPPDPALISLPLPAPAAPLAPIIRQRPEIGEIRSLGQVPSATGLMARPSAPLDDPVTRDLFERGIAPAPRSGRSDDFRWR